MVISCFICQKFFLRRIKRIASDFHPLVALFLLFVAIICTVITVKQGFRLSWIVISAAVYFLAFAMFRSANEV